MVMLLPLALLSIGAILQDLFLKKYLLVIMALIIFGVSLFSF